MSFVSGFVSSNNNSNVQSTWWTKKAVIHKKENVIIYMGLQAKATISPLSHIISRKKENVTNKSIDSVDV